MSGKTTLNSVRFGLVASACMGMLLSANAETVAKLVATNGMSIDVPTGETRRIEYLSASSAVTVSKTGGGRLELAVVDSDRVSLIVSNGTVAAVRPGALSVDDEELYCHFDASYTNTMEISVVNGTNFVTRWNETDGRTNIYGTRISTSRTPFISDVTLNGLSVMDFGPFSGSYVNAATLGASGAGFNLNEKTLLYECFYISMIREGVKDLVPSGTATEFIGPTAVHIGSAVYGGKGGNGVDFNFSNVGAPSATSPEYVIDGTAYNTVTVKPGDGWHTVDVRYNGTWLTNGVPRSADDYGRCALGKRLDLDGGCRLAEVIACTNRLSDASRAYVSAYLSCKWRPASFAKIKLVGSATLDTTATRWRTTLLQIDGAGVQIEGYPNLDTGEIVAGGNEKLAVSEPYAARPYTNAPVPNLSFAANGEISVAEGTARGNIVSAASGTFVKSGAGALELAHLTAEVKDLRVSGGSFTLSPLLSAATCQHFDPSQQSTLTVSNENGTNFVSRWADVNTAGQAFVAPTAKYKFATSRTVNLPYLSGTSATGLPLVDFGSQADPAHKTGWGGGLSLSPAMNGGKTDYAGARQGFIVWEDRDDSIDLPRIEGNEIMGPCLFGNAWAWNRGPGGDGNGFQLQRLGDSPATFRSSLRLDGRAIPSQNVATNRPSRGLHLMDNKFGDSDGGYSLAHIGFHETTTSTNLFTETDGVYTAKATPGVYGGMRFGEVMFFHHYLPALQRTQTEAALGVKWFGGNWKHAYGFESLSVAVGASAAFPYADVDFKSATIAGSVAARSLTVTNLTVSGGAGTVTCPLTLPDGAKLTLGVTSGADGISVSSVTFAGGGTVDASALAPSGIVGRSVRAVTSSSVTAATANNGRIAGWRVKAPNGVYGVLRVVEGGVNVSFKSSGAVLSFR